MPYKYSAVIKKQPPVE